MRPAVHRITATMKHWYNWDFDLTENAIKLMCEDKHKQLSSAPLRAERRKKLKATLSAQDKLMKATSYLNEMEANGGSEDGIYNPPSDQEYTPVDISRLAVPPRNHNHQSRPPRQSKAVTTKNPSRGPGPNQRESSNGKQNSDNTDSDDRSAQSDTGSETANSERSTPPTKTRTKLSKHHFSRASNKTKSKRKSDTEPAAPIHGDRSDLSPLRTPPSRSLARSTNANGPPHKQHRNPYIQHRNSNKSIPTRSQTDIPATTPNTSTPRPQAKPQSERSPTKRSASDITKPIDSNSFHSRGRLPLSTLEFVRTDTKIRRADKQAVSKEPPPNQDSDEDQDEEYLPPTQLANTSEKQGENTIIMTDPLPKTPSILVMDSQPSDMTRFFISQDSGSQNFTSPSKFLRDDITPKPTPPQRSYPPAQEALNYQIRLASGLHSFSANLDYAGFIARLRATWKHNKLPPLPAGEVWFWYRKDQAQEIIFSDEDGYKKMLRDVNATTVIALRVYDNEVSNPTSASRFKPLINLVQVLTLIRLVIVLIEGPG